MHAAKEVLLLHPRATKFCLTLMRDNAGKFVFVNKFELIWYEFWLRETLLYLQSKIFFV